MKNELVEIILRRLDEEWGELKSRFHSLHGDVQVRHFYVDNLLPDVIAKAIYDAFPKDRQAFRRFDSFRERKSTSKDMDRFPQILSDITFALQDARVLQRIEDITGIQGQQPDPKLYAGGLSMMFKDDFLNPHIDNSHDSERQCYRVLNLLYYVTPDWELEHGGNLELWDTHVRRNVTIVSRFNRLVVMETNKTSWHSVSPVRQAGPRCCVSNYYFSKRSPDGHDYFHVTSFMARPEQMVLRVASVVDNFVRSTVRKIFRLGVGPADMYRPRHDRGGPS
jgi:Rps23 Pro-64 3,4-dihydroxylase Tpa1-like proline 4-hydroxylase